MNKIMRTAVCGLQAQILLASLTACVQTKVDGTKATLPQQEYTQQQQRLEEEKAAVDKVKGEQEEVYQKLTTFVKQLGKYKVYTVGDSTYTLGTVNDMDENGLSVINEESIPSQERFEIHYSNHDIQDSLSSTSEYKKYVNIDVIEVTKEELNSTIEKYTIPGKIMNDLNVKTVEIFSTASEDDKIAIQNRLNTIDSGLDKLFTISEPIEIGTVLGNDLSEYMVYNVKFLFNINTIPGFESEKAIEYGEASYIDNGDKVLMIVQMRKDSLGISYDSIVSALINLINIDDTVDNQVKTLLDTNEQVSISQVKSDSEYLMSIQDIGKQLQTKIMVGDADSIPSSADSVDMNSFGSTANDSSTEQVVQEQGQSQEQVEIEQEQVE